MASMLTLSLIAPSLMMRQVTNQLLTHLEAGF
jgi:hypothetical protein